MNKTIPKNKGFAVPLVAIIMAGAALLLVFFLLVFLPYLYHYIAGLVGGGTQPTGNCNIGCGFDETKIGFYENGDAPNIDATSEEAKNFAINTLNIDQTKIKVYSKSELENLIRAEIASQWPKVENTHGSNQAEAQRAILTYEGVEDSSWTAFKLKNGRLVPNHDRCTIQVLSITMDKWCQRCSSICSCSGCNKRKEIALNWDLGYTIYTGVKEHLNKFESSGVSGTGLERWRNTLQAVRATPPFWNSTAEKVWQDYKNEVAYNCYSPCSSSPGDTGPYTGRRTNYLGIEKILGRACNRSNLTTINFMGKNVQVHKLPKAAFEAVNQDIKNSGINYNFWRDPDGGTYNCRRNKNNPSQMSPHAYGIAIDINPDKNPNLRRRGRTTCPHDIPDEIIKIFKSHGFRWGGDFRGRCDAMHFEWMNW